MGPRFNGVEDGVKKWSVDYSEQLQWGHALMAWKTRSPAVLRCGAIKASMGPRFNGVEDIVIGALAMCSMLVLQWGHALMAWKTISSSIAANARDALQWGHALMAWKTDAGIAATGAVTRLQWGHALMAWKTMLASVRECNSIAASMGPRFNGVEDVSDDSDRDIRRNASMGPRFNGVEDSSVNDSP